MEPLFVVAKIIGSSGKNDNRLFIQNCFKCDCEPLQSFEGSIYESFEGSIYILFE